MQILKKLAKDGDMKIVAIPKTIDNDIGATESSIGFHTAVDFPIDEGISTYKNVEKKDSLVETALSLGIYWR